MVRKAKSFLGSFQVSTSKLSTATHSPLAYSNGVLPPTPTAQILFGRQLRSQIPSHTTNFTTNPSNNPRDRDSFQWKTNKAAKLRHNVHARTLPLIPVGTRVRVQHPLTKLWDTTGTIISSNKKRDYRIMMPSGRIYWRNRKYIRPTTSGQYQKHQYASNPEQLPQSSKKAPASTTSSRRHPTRTLDPPRRPPCPRPPRPPNVTPANYTFYLLCYLSPTVRWTWRGGGLWCPHHLG